MSTTTAAVLLTALLTGPTTAAGVTPQTVTLGQPADMHVGDDPQPITATASSGLPVTMNSGTSSVCSVTGSPGHWVLHALSLGTCVVAGVQAGDATYAMSLLTTSFQVVPGPPRHYAPEPPVGVSATLLADPGAAARLRTAGRTSPAPRSRLLTSGLVSRIVWARSPSAGVVRYRVTVDGVPVCSVPAGRTLSCRESTRPVRPGSAVRVVAVGANARTSTAARVPVVRGGLRLVAVVYFGVDDDRLDARARSTLAAVAARSRRYGLTRVTLVGRADAFGASGYNRTLSRRRALAVRAALLLGRSDLSAAVLARGESRATASDVPRAERAADRRVEVYLG